MVREEYISTRSRIHTFALTVNMNHFNRMIHLSNHIFFFLFARSVWYLCACGLWVSGSVPWWLELCSCGAKTSEPLHDGKNVSFHKINNIYIGFLNKFLSIRKYCSTNAASHLFREKKKNIFFSVVIFFFFSAVRSYVRSFGKYLPFHLYECVFAIHISLWFHEKFFYPKIYSYRAYELMAKDERTHLLCDERRRASTCPEDFSFTFFVCGKTIDI